MAVAKFKCQFSTLSFTYSQSFDGGPNVACRLKSSFSFALQRPCKIKQLKDRFPPTVSFIFLTERYIRFWKELRTTRLLYSHILSCKSKMLYGIVSNLAGITPQSRFSFRLHHPSMVFPDLHFTKLIFFLPARLLLKEFTVFWTRTLLPSANTVFHFLFFLS